ncbi:MAG: T9SS type A sorting domain-containing protein, partial [Bacteroidota bacterium]
LEASQGFVNFRIRQQPDLTIGEVIYNQASIYFDSEAPVVTNETWHTIGEPKEEMTNVVENEAGSTRVFVYPNPAIAGYQVVLPESLNPEGRWELYDAQGRLVQTQWVRSASFWLPTKALGSGIYFYKLHLSDQSILQGKLIIE